MEERKKEEAEFRNRLASDSLKENKEQYDYLTSNRKFYSVVRQRDFFIKEWLLKRCQQKRVLDYCCGEGGWAIFSAENGAEAVGIDISQVSIDNAKKKVAQRELSGRASFFVMDAEEMRFEKDYFDIIICHAALHHLDIQRAYPELFRVLKRKGEIVCIEPLAYNPLIQFYRKITPHLRTKWEVDHILTKKEINLAKKYFGKVETKFYSLTTLLAVPFRNSPLFNPLLGILERIDWLLFKIPFLKWGAWTIVFILSQPKK